MATSPLVFTDANTLLASFFAQSPSALSNRNDVTSPVPIHFKIGLFDARVGNVLAVKDFPAPGERGAALATHDGRFLVALPNSLKLYATQLSLLHESSGILQGTPGFDDALWMSPTGRTLAVYHSGHQLLVIDADTLEVRERSAPPASPGDVSITDDLIAIGGEKIGNGPPKWQELLGRFGGPLHDTCYSLDKSCAHLRFLASNLLVYSGDRFELSRSDGSVLLSAVLDDNKSGWADYRVIDLQHGGQDLLFAPVVTSHGGSAFLDANTHSILDRVQVYALSQTPRLVFTDDLTKLAIEDFTDFQISPDGTLLAVLVKGVVSTYRLSSPPAG